MHKRLYENVEFSFGKGVGRDIYAAMNNAKHSIYMVTPYITEGYIDFLLRKKSEGINVSLVTTTEAQRGRMDAIYKKVIEQNRITDENKLANKNETMSRCLTMGLVTLLIELVWLIFYAIHHSSHSLHKSLKFILLANNISIVITSVILFITFMIYNFFYRIHVYSYFYTTKFPFKVVPSIYSQSIPNVSILLDTFVHAKVYIVDNRDIFIGSANFTKSGLTHNIESFIKISSHDKVEEILLEINSELKKSCRPVEINQLGKRLYHEAYY